MKDQFCMFLSANLREGKKGSIVIISLMANDGNCVDVNAAPKFWERFSKFITEEQPYCKVNYTYQSVGDSVTYDGKTIVVKEAGNHLDDMVKVPKLVWEKKVENFIEKDIEIISSLSAENAEAVSAYLRTVRTAKN